MSPQPRKDRKPVTEAVEETTRHAESRTRGSRGRRGGRPSDVFGGELRRRDLFPLLVLHLVARERAYGNFLIEAIEEMTQGVISVNPNTMYPLLRDLEGRGLIEGSWEHPDRRTRRFYCDHPGGPEGVPPPAQGAEAVPRLGDPLGDADRARDLRQPNLKRGQAP